MFIGEPTQTPYDLCFSIMGVPVRIHPFFWIAAAVLGARGGDIYLILLWIVAMLISILVHEFGHVFAMRYFGESARVVLYMMGGLAIPESSVWQSGNGSGRKSADQIIISAAGPAAGFFLAALTVAVLRAVDISVVFSFSNLMPTWAFDSSRIVVDHNINMAIQFAHFMLFINIFWGLLNLMPIYPLDGGQISRELFVQHGGHQGVINSLKLSVATGIGLAILGLSQGSFLMMIMFGSLALSSWQTLQQMSGRGGGFGGGRPW